jgi:hypothetical protein
MIDTDKRLDWWFAYLNSLCWQPGELDRCAYLGFLRAATLSIPEEAAYAEVLRRTRQADPHARFYKLEHQMRLAYQYAGATEWTPNSYHYSPPPPRPEFDAATLKRIAARLPEASPAYLRARSPIDPLEVDPTRFLETVFRPGESAIIFDRFHSQGQLVWRHSLAGDECQRRRLESFRTGKAQGVWFLSNPCDAQWHYNPRQGHQSRRSEESISSFRHLVLESDEADRHEWIAYLCQLDLAVIAIYGTGGNAPHALVRIDAPSKDAWDRFVHPLIPAFVRAGGCRKTLSAVRLSRLPGCRREEKNALQKLYYLNPHPLPGPICELKVLR